MNKIEGIIKDPSSPTATYYSHMCVQAEENRTLEFVIARFRDLDLPRERNHNLSLSLRENNSRHFRNENHQNSRVSNHNNCDSNRDCSFDNTSKNNLNSKRPSDLSSTNDSRPLKKFKYSTQTHRQNENTKDQMPIKHLASTHPDGRYYVKSTLVIPGTQPIYTDEQFKTIKKMSVEDRPL